MKRVVSILLRARALSRAWVLHRDVKGSNLLVDNDGNVKLGLVSPRVACPKIASRHEHRRDAVASSSEPHGATKYDEGVDMWSVGCRRRSSCSANRRFRGRRRKEQPHRIFQTCGSEGRRVAERPGYTMARSPARRVRVDSGNVSRNRRIMTPRVGPRRRVTSLDPRDRGSARRRCETRTHRRARPKPPPSRTCPTATSTRCDTTSRKPPSGVSWTRGLVPNEGDNWRDDTHPRYTLNPRAFAPVPIRDRVTPVNFTFEDTSPGRCSKPQR